MRIEGAILPTGDDSELSRKAWCQFVGSRPEFRRRASTQAHNPFSGEAMTVHPSDDVAEVMLEGTVVGNVYWSMSDEPLVNVSVEPSAMPFVKEWAAALGGEFRPHLAPAEQPASQRQPWWRFW